MENGWERNLEWIRESIIRVISATVHKECSVPKNSWMHLCLKIRVIPLTVMCHRLGGRFTRIRMAIVTLTFESRPYFQIVVQLRPSRWAAIAAVSRSALV